MDLYILPNVYIDGDGNIGKIYPFAMSDRLCRVLLMMGQSIMRRKY